MTVEHVQTKHEIKAVLAQRGLRPRKRYGQNFLIDGNLMRRLADAAEIEPHDTVLEVGGGTGGLTDLLARRAARVVCVEVDRDLAAILRDRFADADHVEIIAKDALQTKHEVEPDVARTIGGADAASTGPIKLVANLPYQSATPLLMNLLVGFPQVRRFCFTVQREVGERIMSRPGCRTYGPISVVAQVLSDVRLVARVPGSAFWPRPAVESVMLRVDVRDAQPFTGRDQLHSFVALVRDAFLHRRKTLRATLASGYGAAKLAPVLDRLGPSGRPESLSVAQWLELHAALRSSGPCTAGDQ